MRKGAQQDFVNQGVTSSGHFVHHRSQICLDRSGPSVKFSTSRIKWRQQALTNVHPGLPRSWANVGAPATFVGSSLKAMTEAQRQPGVSGVLLCDGCQVVALLFTDCMPSGPLECPVWDSDGSRVHGMFWHSVCGPSTAIGWEMVLWVLWLNQTGGGNNAEASTTGKYMQPLSGGSHFIRSRSPRHRLMSRDV
jgi:hypothetical protein